MRYVDPEIKSRALSQLQTPNNKANPSMDVHVIKPVTPIAHPRYWQESVIDNATAATSLSVAVRRIGKNPDQVFAAYVSDNILKVVKSDLAYPLSSLTWTNQLQLAGCSACALAFDGSFRNVDRNVEFFSDDKPWLFLITTTSELRGGKLGESLSLIDGSGVTAVDAVRGFADPLKARDQGMVVFLIKGGLLYYQQRIAGQWQPQILVEMAPGNLVSVHAERTFDWRIILQVMDAAGTLHEIVSKMEASGNLASEYITLAEMSVTTALLQVYHSSAQSGAENISVDLTVEARQLYALAPRLLHAFNKANEDNDFGFFVEVTFDAPVINSSEFPSDFILTDSNNLQWLGSSAAVSGNRVTVAFNNFNDATNPVTLNVISGHLQGDIELVAASSVEFTAQNLVPSQIPPPVPISITQLLEWES